MATFCIRLDSRLDLFLICPFLFNSGTKISDIIFNQQHGSHAERLILQRFHKFKADLQRRYLIAQQQLTIMAPLSKTTFVPITKTTIDLYTGVQLYQTTIEPVTETVLVPQAPIIPPFQVRGSVEMWMNYSPCAICAVQLAQFAKEHPNLIVKIRFIKLYKCYIKGNQIFCNTEGIANRVGLMILLSCENVELDILTEDDYKTLFGVDYKTLFGVDYKTLFGVPQNPYIDTLEKFQVIKDDEENLRCNTDHDFTSCPFFRLVKDNIG